MKVLSKVEVGKGVNDLRFIVFQRSVLVIVIDLLYLDSHN